MNNYFCVLCRTFTSEYNCCFYPFDNQVVVLCPKCSEKDERLLDGLLKHRLSKKLKVK